MNGAESLVHTLVNGGVNVCFSNPGTSEMHFVAALDRVEGMRCVLGLFEGVCSGAADVINMKVLFDKQVNLRMGQANVKRWVPDIFPLLTDEDPLGVESFATHRLPLDAAPEAYETFQKKEDGMVKVVMTP